MTGDAPLTVAELGARLDAIGGFERQPFVAVAVSGGADSMALAILAARWAHERGGTIRALTVDHRLRLESAKEAELVARWLAARGIPHTILTWQGAKPTSGLQEAAREARYRLLTDWCRSHGCLHLLTAHHREDQAETYLIRRRAGSGSDGLAGMAVIRETEGCRIVRPLLRVSRTRLASLLAAERQPFVTDPSNADTRFERARLRGQQNAPVAVDQTLAIVRRHAEARICRERRLAALLARAVCLHQAGFAVIRPDLVRNVPAEIAERLLGRVARTIGGSRYPLRHERLARLAAALRAEPARARTLGGCRFVPWRGRILVLRELAAAAAPALTMPGASFFWDRRFEVAASPDTRDLVTIGYLAMAALSSAQRRSLRENETILPPLVHAVLPALWDKAGIIAVRDLGFLRPFTGPIPSITFRPVNPLSPAGFTVV